jgi:hypothetical protein
MHLVAVHSHTHSPAPGSNLRVDAGVPQLLQVLLQLLHIFHRRTVWHIATVLQVFDLSTPFQKCFEDVWHFLDVWELSDHLRETREGRRGVGQDYIEYCAKYRTVVFVSKHETGTAYLA